MGANLIVFAGRLFLPFFQHDTTNTTDQPCDGIAYERLSDLLRHNGSKAVQRLMTLLLLLTGACRTAPDRTGPAGHLEVQWTGKDGGKLSGPATAEWCAIRRLLEIRTAQGDTGIALALYPRETLAAGLYSVVNPAKAESVPPAAGIALRWVTQNAVQGFQGDSGTVALEQSNPGQFSGKVRARARSVVDTQQVAIRGTFRDLTVNQESRGCAAPLEHPGEDAEPRDTGVH